MRNKIKKYLKSKDNKVLVENLFSLSLLQVVGYVLPFLTLPYIAKTIGVLHFGEIAFASAVIMFFQVLTDFGFNYTGVRDISKVGNDKVVISKIFSSILFSKIILMTISFLILMFLIVVIPYFRINKRILMYTFLIIPGYAIYPEWFFQAVGKMRYTAIFTTIIKLVFTLLIFVFVRVQADYILIPLINGFGYFVIGACSFVVIYREGYTIKSVSLLSVFRVTRKSANMFLSLLLPNLYTSGSVIFLNMFFGSVAVGIYDAGLKFIGIATQCATVISRSFFPLLAKKGNKYKWYEFLSLGVSIFISIALFIFAPIIINIFYNESFSSSIIVLRIMSLSVIFIFFSYTYGHNNLVINNKEYLLRNIIGICSIVGLALSYLLIRQFSFIGAAAALSLIYSLRGVLVFYYSKFR